jgi:hypothetical protein
MKGMDQSVHPAVKLSECDPFFAIDERFVFWIKESISINDVSPSSYAIPA